MQASDSKKGKIGPLSGIPIGLGSILGSGILFLPSLTIGIASDLSIYSWVLATFICASIIPVLKKITTQISEEEGIAGFLGAMFGQHIGKIFPLFVLSTILVGMPLSSNIAAKYAQTAFTLHDTTAFAISLGIPLWATLSVLLSVSAGSLIQLVNALIFFLLGIYLGVMAINAETTCSTNLPEPSLVSLGAATGLAFWAFAGFENLLFMAKKFKNPSRDILIVSIFSLILSGGLYLFLTFSLLKVCAGSSDTGIDLIYLARGAQQPGMVILAVGLFAVLALTLNFSSWIRGVSNLITEGSNNDVLPNVFKSQFDKNGWRSQASLGVTLSTLSALFFFLPEEYAGVLFGYVSSNFIIIYVTLLLAYSFSSIGMKKIMSLLASGILLLFSLSTGASAMLTALIVVSLLIFSKVRLRTG